MRLSRNKSHTSLLQATVFSFLVSGCTGVLNDPSVRNGLGIVLRNDEVNSYLWHELEEIKGNKAEVIIGGECSSDIPTIDVSATHEDGTATDIHFSIPCSSGTLAATFKDTNRFPSNGRYKITFSGNTGDVAGVPSQVSKIYDFFYEASPSQMVNLQCNSVLIASPFTVTPVAFQNIDECSIPKTSDLRLDGSCSASAEEHGTIVKIQGLADKACNATFAEMYAGLTSGAHLIPITWVDLWGNTFTRTLLIKKLTDIDYWGGGVSFLASGSRTSTNNLIDVAMAVGSPFVPYTADVTNATPFSRAPASETGGGTDHIEMAPGYLSLVYGLSADD